MYTSVFSCMNVSKFMHSALDGFCTLQTMLQRISLSCVTRHAYRYITSGTTFVSYNTRMLSFSTYSSNVTATVYASTNSLSYLYIALLHWLLVFCFSHPSNCGRCSMTYIVASIHNLMIAFNFYWQSRLSLVMCPFKFHPDFFLRQALHYEVQASLEFNISSRILDYKQMPPC